MNTNMPGCKNLKTIGEYSKCHKEIMKKIINESYFFNASLYGISKHFLNDFLDINVWQADFENILQSYQTTFEDNSCPTQVNDFYQYIANEYLELREAPKESLFKLYEKSNQDLIQIKNTIKKLENSIQDIDIKKESTGYLEVEDRYRIKHIKYYIAKNEQAREDIIQFLCDDIKDVAYQNSKIKDTNMGLFGSFFGSKHYPYNNMTQRFFSFINIYDIDYFSDLDNKMLELDLPAHKKVSELLKQDNKTEVLQCLKDYMETYKLLDQMNIWIDTNHILNTRKEIIHQIFKHINNQDYISVNNMLPLQIEGLFHDFCLLIGVKEKELNIASLNYKLDKLQEGKSDLSYFSYEYFSFRFPVIRNKVAHGRYFDANDEFQAIYLIYDLFTVCEMITNERIELNSYIKLINDIDIKTNDFDNRLRLIKLLKNTLPSFYSSEIIKLDVIKSQYLEERFLADFENFIASYSGEYSENIATIIGLLKSNCLEKGDKKLDYLFKKMNNSGVAPLSSRLE